MSFSRDYAIPPEAPTGYASQQIESLDDMLDRPDAEPEPEAITATSLLGAALAEIDRRRAQIMAILPLADRVLSCLYGYASDARFSVSDMVCGASVWVTIPVATMDEIADIRRRCAQHGLHLPKYGTVSEYPDENRQVHELRADGLEGSAYLNFHMQTEADNGRTCRYVQTGTKEVPTYELRCDEGVKP